jgi:hypothetical protein
MPIIHDVDQYSEAWDALRIGIPTASQFFRIITPTGKKSDQYKDYAYHLIAERCLKRAIDTFKSEHMERGAELEPEAANYYALMHRNRKIERVGFVTDDAGRYGCSPDRLIDNDGMLEIKCPKPNTMVKYLIEQSIEDKYKPQIQGQIFIAQREWVDVLSYHPEPEMEDAIITLRVYRDDLYCIQLDKYLKDFYEFLGEGLTKIGKHLEQVAQERPQDINKFILGG